MRVGTQGLCHLCLKTFVAPFLPTRLTARPWVSEDELDKAKQREQVCFDFKLLPLAGQGG